MHARVPSPLEIAGPAPARAHGARRGFTLVELLITISIIGIMSSMILFAMFQAQQTANEHKTRALIAKLNSIILRRYDEYRTRRVPIQFTPTELAAGPQAMAKIRMDCLRDIMRLEMPDRWSDVTDGPVTPFTRAAADRIRRPAVSQAYLDKHNAGTAPTTVNQGAECLYMIVMGAMAQEGDSRDFFKADDIADTDGDGFPEFVDAWNQPIQFVRWAPGYQSDLQSPIRLTVDIAQQDAHTAVATVTANQGPRLSQTPGSYVGGTLAVVDENSGIIDTRYMARITGYFYDNTVPTVRFTCTTPSTTNMAPFGGYNNSECEVLVMQPDPFDQRQVYPIYPQGAASFPPGEPDTSIPSFAIYPLIFSKGKDRVGGIVDDVGTIRYADTTVVALNPFYVPPPITEAFGLMLGSALNQGGTEPNWYKGSHLDNITNHQLNTR